MKLQFYHVGTNKEAAVKSLLKFHKYFDQVIILGYPPFVKDLADELDEYQSKLKKTKISNY